MAQFQVRVGTGNGTVEQRVIITANNQEQAKKQAANVTGGKALGVMQK